MSDKPWAQRKRMNECKVLHLEAGAFLRHGEGIEHRAPSTSLLLSMVYRDEWRAPELLPWRCGAEGVIAGDCLNTEFLWTRRHGLRAWDLTCQRDNILQSAPSN